mgnify:CR=1 FL=1
MTIACKRRGQESVADMAETTVKKLAETVGMPV